ncbi:putative non-transporter ABC protein [Tieghemostelium lacteum]|uniref:Putative non-transporter ABC protein n=1 Tax=Tieghemostelium lacteum TaxID=361077 RepID=A0A152A6A8_TIELA|nr:putative non-transporter ABC protein [Tieghemostelium lacteum]|eukprot:KYR01762.1 putative non-transporter ABC protein [Tieghemostelium lacteum]
MIKAFKPHHQLLYNRYYNFVSYSTNTNKIDGNKKEDWKKLLFTDLHVSTKTLDRTIQVLQKVREISVENRDGNGKPMDVVFLGDFWHQRNLLYVRHLDLLLQEFNEWDKQSIGTTLLVGNHDQVTLNGQVHGLQMFELYKHFKVCTDPFYDHNSKCAYLPWRETRVDQTMLFDRLSQEEYRNGGKWTVFAHAEVKGAISNGGYKSSGKIDEESIYGNKNIRSCYLGHYHKRQMIGDNVWYIGSPYQQNFGEMYDPHGVAIVNSLNIQPQFIDFTELPKHHKLTFPVDFQSVHKSKISDIKSKDYVEVKATKQHMKSDDYIKSLQHLPPSIELRRIMLNDDIPVITTAEGIKGKNGKQIKSISDKHSNVAFKLEDYIDHYVEEKVREQGDGTDDRVKELVYLGKDILSSIKQDSIVPLGRKVDIKKN